MANVRSSEGDYMNFLLDPAYAIYVALAAALAVWGGVFAFLWRMEQHVRELRRQLDAPVEAVETPQTVVERRTPVVEREERSTL